MKKILFWVIAMLFIISPVGILVLQSFTSPGSWTEFSLYGWRGLFETTRLLEATGTSLTIGFFVTVINIAVGMSAGKALALYTFHGKTAVDTLFVMPLLVPILAITFGVHIAMIRIGLADTGLGVILIHLVPTVPYSIRIFRNGYVSLGRRMQEQAETLGASAGRTFFDIELPLLKPSVQSVIFLTFVISLSQYVITSIIGGGTVVTLAMVYFPFLDSADTTLIAAFSIWFAVLPLLFYITAGAVFRLLPYRRKSGRRELF
ncbi:ABC transporter permease [Salimicrobium album]|uniref:Spermidine/putrescine transport system permease protein n=1 Tax=Salimicrobium album TaxID=50717 RepID=A0A1H3BJ46_9BACI|nr:ABC transporter permease subunit [Salimicrobium album]SDX41721.1 putative spermidine/putrescine transport system permease protein [Salimicrobium album]